MGGSGTIDEVGSGAFGPLDVTWAARDRGVGRETSPEELIAAAHASCFSMAFAHALAQAATPPERLATSATVTFVPGTGITKSRSRSGPVPGLDEDAFREAAEAAKDELPGLEALRHVELSVRPSSRARPPRLAGRTSRRSRSRERPHGSGDASIALTLSRTRAAASGKG